MRVKNINGASQNACKCGSWLDHWKKFGDQSVPTYCLEKSCTKKDLVGAHVQKDSSSDRDWYIIPLCSEHNGKNGNTLDVADHAKLVSANISATCGK